MMFGPSGRDHDSQNHLSLTLETPNEAKNTEPFFNALCLEIPTSWKAKQLETLETTRVGTSLKSVDYSFEDIEYDIDIFQKT